ncbi:isopenicillin N synthase family dioxygenase [Paraburkholderia silviterrae]|uniref:2-oxoglutarate-dependent ethylene/succinate-forming enzyme n=1 Tax=Paraburkholderia silviterrae TaxID=2528715 RepID=A0A4R5M137_9BURK|nr:2OG-Fe(II) oxygenase family protein [Paraburkholderia silviterrae]TDG18687.1 isopenicillin N synthase family oxygenase [Paraburkholderia silviterrae]
MENTFTIPIINSEAIYSDSGRAREALANKINDAAVNFGMFYITGLGIDPSSVREQSEIFHSMPSAYKDRYRIGTGMRHAGYVPLTEKGLYGDEGKRRRYESFDLSLETVSAEVGNNIFNGPINWPDLPSFKDIVYIFFCNMIHISRELSTVIEMSLDVEPGAIVSKMNHPSSQLRLLHYIENGDPPDITDTNMGAHTDYECFTILYQDSPGLQAQIRNGAWVPVPPIVDAFVVNIGDMLECLTNGYWKSNSHRVINTGKERYSIPFFSSLDFNSKISPHSRFATQKHGMTKYREIVAGYHLLEQVTRDFTYLRELHEAGDLELPNGMPSENPFQYTVDEGEM